MCGLFGWNFAANTANEYASSVRVLALSLAQSNDDRGGDSWGGYSVTEDKLHKGLKLMAHMDFAAFDGLASSDAVILHTRKATTGKVEIHNSHPFRCGDIVGAHNGIVYNHSELQRNYGRQCEVDSQQIFHHLHDRLPLSEIEAYGAICYVDAKHPGEMFIGKFNHGEMGLARIEGLGLVWSSDWTHLENAIELAGWADYVTYLKMEDDTLYRINNKQVCTRVCALDIATPYWGVSDSDYAATGSSRKSSGSTTTKYKTTGGLWPERKSKKWKKKQKYASKAPASATIVQPSSWMQTAPGKWEYVPSKEIVEGNASYYKTVKDENGKEQVVEVKKYLTRTDTTTTVTEKAASGYCKVTTMHGEWKNVDGTMKFFPTPGVEPEVKESPFVDFKYFEGTRKDAPATLEQLTAAGYAGDDERDYQEALKRMQLAQNCKAFAKGLQDARAKTDDDEDLTDLDEQAKEAFYAAKAEQEEEFAAWEVKLDKELEAQKKKELCAELYTLIGQAETDMLFDYFSVDEIDRMDMHELESAVYDCKKYQAEDEQYESRAETETEDEDDDEYDDRLTSRDLYLLSRFYNEGELEAMTADECVLAVKNLNLAGHTYENCDEAFEYDTATPTTTALALVDTPQGLVELDDPRTYDRDDNEELALEPVADAEIVNSDEMAMEIVELSEIPRTKPKPCRTHFVPTSREDVGDKDIGTMTDLELDAIDWRAF